MSGDADFSFFIEFFESGAQSLQAVFAVKILASFFAAYDHNAGRAMHKPHARFGFVDMLTAFPSRPERAHITLIKEFFISPGYVYVIRAGHYPKLPLSDMDFFPLQFFLGNGVVTFRRVSYAYNGIYPYVRGNG